MSRQTQPLTDVEEQQSPEASSPKWSAEDQALIDWVCKNFDEELFPIAGKTTWNKIQRTLAEGPNGRAAKDRSLPIMCKCKLNAPSNEIIA